MEQHPIIKQVSFETMMSAMRNSWHRFPLTVIYVLALALWQLLVVNNLVDYIPQDGIPTYILATGTLLTLTIYLWGEEKDRTGKLRILQTTANLLLFCDAIFLYCHYDNISNSITIGHSSVIVALIIALFCIPYIGKQQNDFACWNYAFSLFKSTVIVWLIAIIMVIAISVIIITAETLLHFTSSALWYSFMIIGCYAIEALIFLGLIPAGNAKHDNIYHPTKFLTGLTRYLFLPTTAILLITLYAYAAKILLRWELPNGNVCGPVISAMAACCIIEFLLYPSQRSGTSTKDAVIARWLPVGMLPLLILMTVAILRRILDYGITVERLYVITFNIWSYVVCVRLFTHKARRFYWIPCSFSVVFLLTSIFPVNYSTITETFVKNDLKTELAKLTPKPFPLSRQEYDNILNSLQDNDKEFIEDKRRYLQYNFGKSSFASIINYTEETANINEVVSTSQNTINQIKYTCDTIITIPAGYTKMQRFDNLVNFDITDAPLVTVNDEGLAFYFPATELRMEKDENITPNVVVCPIIDNDSCIFVVDHYQVRFNNEGVVNRLNIAGYLFKK